MMDSDWTRPSFSSAPEWILEESAVRFYRRVTVTNALKMSLCLCSSGVSSSACK